MNIEALDKFDRMETSKPKEADKPFLRILSRLMIWFLPY